MAMNVVDFEIKGAEMQFVGKVRTALFGGEGLFLARLAGPHACC